MNAYLVISNEEEKRFPLYYCQKTVTTMDGKKITLTNPLKCFQKFGVEPGQNIKNSHTNSERFTVIGMGKLDGWLWVKKECSRKAFAIAKKNEEELKIEGYFWKYPHKRKREEETWTDLSKIENQPAVLKIVKNLFNSVSYNVIFQIGDEEIGAHENYLTAASIYFETLFKWERVIHSDGKKKISLPNYDAKVFRQLICYLYTGEITIDQDNILDLSFMADQFFIESLKLPCKQRMAQIINNEFAIKCFNILSGTNHFLFDIVNSYIIDKQLTF